MVRLSFWLLLWALHCLVVAVAAWIAGGHWAKKEHWKESEGTLIPMTPRRTLTFPRLNLWVHVPGCCSCACRGLGAFKWSEPSAGPFTRTPVLWPRATLPLEASTRRGPPGARPSTFTEENESCFIPQPLHSSHYDERAPQSGARAVIFLLQHERFICLTNQFFALTSRPAFCSLAFDRLFAFLPFCWFLFGAFIFQAHFDLLDPLYSSLSLSPFVIFLSDFGFPCIWPHTACTYKQNGNPQVTRLW